MTAWRWVGWTRHVLAVAALLYLGPNAPIVSTSLLFASLALLTGYPLRRYLDIVLLGALCVLTLPVAAVATGGSILRFFPSNTELYLAVAVYSCLLAVLFRLGMIDTLLYIVLLAGCIDSLTRQQQGYGEFARFYDIEPGIGALFLAQAVLLVALAAIRHSHLRRRASADAAPSRSGAEAAGKAPSPRLTFR
jgi:hypothetical protein